MKHLLITGFDPFGGASVNPAWEAVKALPDEIGIWHLNKLEISTVFGKAADTVWQAAENLHPDAIICVGQAGGRSAVTVERIGINIRSANLCDNEGNQPREEKILPDGADGLFSTLPVAAMAEAICAANLPGAVSNSAGTFVCNDTLYTLLSRCAGTETRVGFIHVPFLPEQGTPSMALSDMVKALTAAIEVL